MRMSVNQAAEPASESSSSSSGVNVPLVASVGSVCIVIVVVAIVAVVVVVVRRRRKRKEDYSSHHLALSKMSSYESRRPQAARKKSTNAKAKDKGQLLNGEDEGEQLQMSLIRAEADQKKNQKFLNQKEAAKAEFNSRLHGILNKCGHSESPERKKGVKKQEKEKKDRIERLTRIEMGSKDVAKNKSQARLSLGRSKSKGRVRQ